MYSTIVNGDMVWKLGKFQSVYNELRYYVESASPCTNLLKFCLLIFQQYGWVIQQGYPIGWLLHYAKNSLSSPCTSLHKLEQKHKTKTLVKFPDHISIDYDSTRIAYPKCVLNMCEFWARRLAVENKHMPIYGVVLRLQNSFWQLPKVKKEIA